MSDEVKHCPSCGGTLAFDPKTGTLSCAGCGYSAQEGEVTTEEASNEKDLRAMLGRDEINESPEQITVKCPSCGAETEFPANHVAGFCQFCKSPIVASSKAQKTIRPQGLLPFKVTESAARDAFVQWRNGLWFAPGSLKGSQILTQMKGRYTPVWTFDFETKTYYRGRRGEDYQVTETYTENGKQRTRTVTKTRWYDVTGIVYDSFDDILVYGSNTESRRLMNGLAPWDVKNAQDYKEDAIRGFIEESYDIPIGDGLAEAKDKADSTIESSIRQDIGGNHQTISSKSVFYSELTYKLLLLPLWENRYRFNGKDYIFVVNGQTGKASGQRPWSPWKIILFILILVAIVGTLAYFGMRSK